MTQYTLEEIRQAFWDCFHEMGEFYFSFDKYEPEDSERITESYFQEFVECLELVKVKNE